MFQPTKQTLFRAMLAFAAGCVIGTPTDCPGADISVSSAAEIATALQTAMPGDTLVMTNGTWTNQQIQFAGDGVMGAPITLRAETPGQVILNGNSSVNISGDWLVVDGLNFDGGSLGANDHIVEFRGSNGEATNSRFTNSAIVNYNPADINTRYFWVSMYGESNRVDNNFFSGQNHSGVTVTVWRDSDAPDRHLIDNNYFADRPEGNGNGFETIRIGTSQQSLSNSFTTVESNLFERTDGEIEIISNKSGNNTFRYNTFRDASGTLTLRHGNENRVEGNFFLGENRNGSGGVRVIGEDQAIVNNYFQGLDGRADGAISISAGDPNAVLNGHALVRNALIAHNTIVDVNQAAITFDHSLGSTGRTFLAENVTIANNAIFSTQDPLFEGNEGVGWTWEGNVAFGQSLGPKQGDAGITVDDPELAIGTDGLFRPLPTSPLIDNAVAGYAAALTPSGATQPIDMDGQPRLGIFDIGADEVSEATIVRKPLTAADVGPEWLGNDPGPPDPPSGGGCGLALGCAIQAEDFTAILDPDGDGNRWSVVTVPEALGGEVLKAPLSGDRIDAPGETHDTIATFDVEFDAAGTYRAYYRARGFDGSSDSLYAPNDFAVDPDDIETLSNNGVFRWERNSTEFVIDASLVDMPLEFRLAMREQRAELDAFVISTNHSLTDEQLDALFDVLLGDYNGDGFVDAADYSVWRDALGQTGAGLAADGDGSGEVDQADYELWRQNYGQASAIVSLLAASTAVPEPQSLLLFAVCLAAAAATRRPYSHESTPT